MPDVMRGVRDRTTGIFGNWPLNTAFAESQGLDARVARFYAIEQLEREISEGRPAIISIAFNPGELDGAPIRSTSGHLIVVRGFTENGDVIVNDPIAPNSQSVRLVYKREQLGRSGCEVAASRTCCRREEQPRPQGNFMESITSYSSFDRGDGGLPGRARGRL